MKIVALIGEPASGKTTLAKSIMSRLSMGSVFKNGLVVGTYHMKESLYIIGDYSNPDKIFSGTDRLSMGVQPKADQFLRDLKTNQNNCFVFFEGDRLSNKSFFKTCSECGEFGVFLLKTSPEEKSIRHKKRSDSQSESFLKSRKTKIQNLCLDRADLIELVNENHEDLSDNINKILGFFGL